MMDSPWTFGEPQRSSEQDGGAPGSCILETRYLGLAVFTLIQVGECKARVSSLDHFNPVTRCCGRSVEEKTHLSLPTEVYALQANVQVPSNICIYEDIVMNDTFFFSS